MRRAGLFLALALLIPVSADAQPTPPLGIQNDPWRSTAQYLGLIPTDPSALRDYTSSVFGPQGNLPPATHTPDYLPEVPLRVFRPEPARGLPAEIGEQPLQGVSLAVPLQPSGMRPEDLRLRWAWRDPYYERVVNNVEPQGFRSGFGVLREAAGPSDLPRFNPVARGTYPSSVFAQRPFVPPAEQIPEEIYLGRLGRAFEPRSAESPLPPELGREVYQPVEIGDLTTDEELGPRITTMPEEVYVPFYKEGDFVTRPPERLRFDVRERFVGRGEQRYLSIMVHNRTRWLCTDANLLVQFGDSDDRHSETFLIGAKEEMEFRFYDRATFQGRVVAVATCDPVEDSDASS